MVGVVWLVVVDNKIMAAQVNNTFSVGLNKVVNANSAAQDKDAAVIDFYGDIAQKYEKECIQDLQFMGPNLTVEYFIKHAEKLNLDKGCRILDVAAGTGLVGQMLQKHGFTNIDATDGSQPMLDLARSKGAYRNYVQSYIGPGHRLPFDDASYDAAMISGGVLPGHIKPSSLTDVIRVIKPGGLFLNTMRESFTRDVPEYDVRTLFSQWERDGKWRLLEWAIPVSAKYYNGLDGLVQVYQIL